MRGNARMGARIARVSSPHLTHVAVNSPVASAPVYCKPSKNKLLVYKSIPFCMGVARNQAVACCPAIGGLLGTHLAEMKSTAYGDLNAKALFAC